MLFNHRGLPLTMVGSTKSNGAMEDVAPRYLDDMENEEGWCYLFESLLDFLCLLINLKIFKGTQMSK